MSIFMRFLFVILSGWILLSCSNSNEPDSAPYVDSLGTIKSPIAIEHTYQKYCNRRFEFCLEFPSDLLTQEPESENGDGTTFFDKNRDEKLRVWGAPDTDSEGEEMDLSTWFVSEKKDFVAYGGQISYELFQDDWFVISGTLKGDIYYRKTLLKKTGFVNAVLQYHSSEKESFNSVVENLNRSLK